MPARVTPLILVFAALPNLAQAQSLTLEPPLAGGAVQANGGDGYALPIVGLTELRASDFGPRISTLSLDDDGRVLRGDDVSNAPALPLSLPDGFVYGVIEVTLSSGMPPAEVGHQPVTWQGDGPMFTTLTLEIYRGGRNDLESWLTAMQAHATAGGECGPDGVPFPVHLMTADLNGDGQPEGLTTLATSVGTDWFCRWAVVHTLDPSPAVFGTIGHGAPYVSVVTLNGPSGPVPVISSHFQCCDLDQTFRVYALRGSELVSLFDNNATPDGRTGFGYWVEGSSGPEIRFTESQEIYHYGSPTDPASLDVYRFDGTGLVAEGATGSAVGQICRHGGNAAIDTALPCPEGLTCCYPCGIPGCDWQCMDVAAGECPRLP